MMKTISMEKDCELKLDLCLFVFILTLMTSCSAASKTAFSRSLIYSLDLRNVPKYCEFGKNDPSNNHFSPGKYSRKCFLQNEGKKMIRNGNEYLPYLKYSGGRNGILLKCPPLKNVLSVSCTEKFMIYSVCSYSCPDGYDKVNETVMCIEKDPFVNITATWSLESLCESSVANNASTLGSSSADNASTLGSSSADNARTLSSSSVDNASTLDSRSVDNASTLSSRSLDASTLSSRSLDDSTEKINVNNDTAIDPVVSQENSSGFTLLQWIYIIICLGAVILLTIGVIFIYMRCRKRCKKSDSCGLNDEVITLGSSSADSDENDSSCDKLIKEPAHGLSDLHINPPSHHYEDSHIILPLRENEDPDKQVFDKILHQMPSLSEEDIQKENVTYCQANGFGKVENSILSKIVGSCSCLVRDFEELKIPDHKNLASVLEYWEGKERNHTLYGFIFDNYKRFKFATTSVVTLYQNHRDHREGVTPYDYFFHCLTEHKVHISDLLDYFYQHNGKDAVDVILKFHDCVQCRERFGCLS